jgi:hypothetical protein
MSKSLDIFRHFKKEIEGFNKSRLEEIFIKEFIKDLGKKWFGFSKMDKESFEMMGRVK